MAPQFVMGGQGMLRRHFDHSPEYTPWHVVSSCGSYLQGIGFLVAAYCLLQSWKSGRAAPANPWGGNTLEWHCPSPPPPLNFEKEPTSVEAYSYSDLKYDEEVNGYVSAGG